MYIQIYIYIYVCIKISHIHLSHIHLVYICSWVWPVTHSVYLSLKFSGCVWTTKTTWHKHTPNPCTHGCRPEPGSRGTSHHFSIPSFECGWTHSDNPNPRVTRFGAPEHCEAHPIALMAPNKNKHKVFQLCRMPNNIRFPKAQSNSYFLPKLRVLRHSCQLGLTSSPSWGAAKALGWAWGSNERPSNKQLRHIFSGQTERNKIAPVVVDVGVIWIIIDMQTNNHSFALVPKQLDALHDLRLILCKLKARNHTTPQIRTRFNKCKYWDFPM